MIPHTLSTQLSISIFHNDLPNFLGVRSACHHHRLKHYSWRTTLFVYHHLGLLSAHLLLSCYSPSFLYEHQIGLDIIASLMCSCCSYLINASFPFWQNSFVSALCGHVFLHVPHKMIVGHFVID